MINLMVDSVDKVRVAYDAIEGKGSYDRDYPMYGPGYNEERPDTLSFEWAEGRLLKLRMELDCVRDEKYRKENLMELVKTRDIIAEIYGNGGIHRYYVLANGSVEFSRMHLGYAAEWKFGGEEEAFKAIIAVGFDIRR